MTEKAQYEAKGPLPEEIDRLASIEVFDLLSQPMPTEALSIDESRGFQLTSIKAGFILERLNQTFGLLGYGWRYAVGSHHLETAGGKEESLVEVAVQWRITDSTEDFYCPPVYWLKKADPETGVIAEGWGFSDKTLPCCWSEPVFATGGSSAKRKGSVPLTDARRSAVTNAITKAAARMGVGNEVFKGQDELVNSPTREKQSKKASPRQSGPPKSAKAPIRLNRPGNPPISGYPDLEAMRVAVLVAKNKLTFEDTDRPEAKMTQNLAQKMAGMGIEMQAARLVYLLLGEGGFTQKGVMATNNVLNSGKVTPANVEALNTAGRG